MRRISYKEVLRGAAETSGRIFGVLSGDDAELLRGFISRRLKEAWEAQFWPELMVVEQRTISNKLIPYSQTELNDLVHVMTVTDADPRQTRSLATYDFDLTADGLSIQSYSGESATLWVTHRKRVPVLNGINWKAGTFQPGDQVYHKAQGDFYDQAGTNATALEPPTSPWARVEIPWIFSTFLQRAAASDMLLLDEKSDLALAQKQMADDALAIEMANLRQQSQHTNIKIKTHRGA